VTELWGLGDLALAVPFLRAAAGHARVTLFAKPYAAPLLRHFAPAVELVPFVAPWTAFRGKYRLQRWPWRKLAALRRTLRAARFDLGISARPDPRDHAVLALAGCRARLGFPRVGSRLLLTRPLAPPSRPHRSEFWRALARELDWSLATEMSRLTPPRGQRVVIHSGAGQPVRQWPVERFREVARQLETAGWSITLLDDSLSDVDRLLDTLADADRFIGNDSGPGHLAALLGVPTFTIFGPQLPELFAPQHPRAAWVEGAPCPFKPCFDSCRFAAPHCIQSLATDEVWRRVSAWLATG
jgi:heptosyltransferase-2